VLTRERERERERVNEHENETQRLFLELFQMNKRRERERCQNRKIRKISCDKSARQRESDRAFKRVFREREKPSSPTVGAE